MQYYYQTATGKQMIEVDEAWGKILLSLDKKQQNKKRVVRRHEVYSMDEAHDFFEQLGAEDAGIEALTGTQTSSATQKVICVLAKMQPQQAELLLNVLVDEIPQKQLALAQGVTPAAISYRLKQAKKEFVLLFLKEASIDG